MTVCSCFGGMSASLSPAGNIPAPSPDPLPGLGGGEEAVTMPRPIIVCLRGAGAGAAATRPPRGVSLGSLTWAVAAAGWASARLAISDS